MRQSCLFLAIASALLVALIACLEGSNAQPPPGKKGPPDGKKKEGKKKDGPQQPISRDQIVDRIMAFDNNSDGKVTADELPERMQHLLALGDVNKDGGLDRTEVAQLSALLEEFASLVGPGPNVGPKGPKGLKGDGKGPKGDGKGPKGDGKGGPLKGVPPKGLAADVLRALDEMEIKGPVRKKADQVVRTQVEKVRRYDELLLADLIVQMKDILQEEEYQIFKFSVDRPGGPKDKGLPPQDVSGRLDQVLKDIDELRQKAAK